MIRGGWNYALGWLLLIAGFAGGAWLDPWSFQEKDPGALVGSTRMMLRHAQAVVVGMAFLQLMVGRILFESSLPSRAARSASVITLAGALIYIAGYLFHESAGFLAWLVPIGATLNFFGFGWLFWACPVHQGSHVRIYLAIICGGMLLDVAVGVFAADGGVWQPAYLGAEDGVRLRMLRLARAAFIALSTSTLLFQDLRRADLLPQLTGWANIALVVGAVGMPLTLTVAALTFVEFKYLLGIPATATVFGAGVAFWLAIRQVLLLQSVGWFLIVVSMGVGMLMGWYAFDGPLPPPEFVGQYNDFARRGVRLTHAYCIVFGFICIFLAKQPVYRLTCGSLIFGPGALLVGIATTLLGILTVTMLDWPTELLTIGPSMVAVGLIVILSASIQVEDNSLHFGPKRA